MPQWLSSDNIGCTCLHPREGVWPVNPAWAFHSLRHCLSVWEVKRCFRWKWSNFTEEGVKILHVQTSHFLVCFELGGMWLINICLTAVRKKCFVFFCLMCLFFSLIGDLWTSYNFLCSVTYSPVPRCVITSLSLPTSTQKNQFLGQQRPDLSHPDKLNRTKMGWQELSGYSENTDRFVKVADDSRRFITHYMTR